MNTEMLWILAGIFVGIIIAFMMFKITNKDGSVKCRYDERQELVRGRGYKYAFFTLILYNVLFAIIDSVSEKRFMDSSIEMFIGVCISIMVYVSYCIWNEGYFSLNQRPKRILALFIIIGAYNIILSIGKLREGMYIKDGKLTFSASNFICGILMLVLAVVASVKMISNKKEEE